MQWKFTAFQSSTTEKKIGGAILTDSLNFYWISDTFTDSNLEWEANRMSLTGRSLHPARSLPNTVLQNQISAKDALMPANFKHWNRPAKSHQQVGKF